MKVDKTVVMFGMGVIFSLLQGAFWYWVKGIKQDSDKIRKELSDLKSEIYKDFQTKDDAQKNFERIMSSLEGIKADIHRLNDKLDRKADKD